MKTLLWFLLFAFAPLSLRAADTPRPLPSEITLKNGAKVRGIESVVRWQSDRVTVKHAGGTDPVLFINMAPESRTIWEERSKIALPEQRKLEDLQAAAGDDKRAREQKAAADAEAWRKRVAAAIGAKQLLVGMTRAEALQSWGEPGNKNVSGGAGREREQWVYYEQTATPGRAAPRTYVYFSGGVLASWQRSE